MFPYFLYLLHFPTVYTMTLLANVIGGLILLFHAGEFETLFLAMFYIVTLISGPWAGISHRVSPINRCHD